MPYCKRAKIKIEFNNQLWVFVVEFKKMLYVVYDIDRLGLFKYYLVGNNVSHVSLFMNLAQPVQIVVVA